MVATDGHRLALVEVAADEPSAGGKDGQDGVLVPRKALQELQRFEGDARPSAFRRGEHHLVVPPRPARADLPHPRRAPSPTTSG